MRVLLILGVLLLAACSSGGDDNENDPQQIIVRTSWETQGTAITLNLLGPQGAGLLPVTYYVFGSNTDFGDRVMVPLQAQRMGEQSFGPFGFSEGQNNVDLSPWAAYSNIYVRAVPVNNNVIWALRPGYIYSFGVE